MSLDHIGTTFEVKAVEQRVISGHAAAWALDRVGDVIDRKAFTRTLTEKRPADVAVFIGHKADELPVGVPLEIAPDEHGLFTRVKVFDGPSGDNLLAVAKGLKAAGQTLGLSIGYRVRDSRMERTDGKSVRVLTDIDLIEFSYAARQTVANPAALMTDVKQGGGSMYSIVEKAGRYHVMKAGESLADFGSEDEAKARMEELNRGKTMPNTLPDSAFLYVAPGGQLDDEGKTVPRGHRHFRYRDADGALDREALHEAIASMPEAKIGLDDRELRRLQARARRLAGTGPAAADGPEWKAGTVLDLLSAAYTLLDMADRLVTEHKAFGVVGESTGGGKRMRTEMRAEIQRVADSLGVVVEQSAMLDRGEEGKALADWWRAQFDLLEVYS